ncbi:MAG TPA: calcium-binding protein [Candidatus Binatia bacterium]|nr:calcium-binding protein [Candidatus Binatia bacterium]
MTDITGTAGNDTLIGTKDSDHIDGGVGADRMIGGAGDDTYVVDDKGDRVIEGIHAGTDGVTSFLASYTLAANVENLSLDGTAITGIGNELANTIVGDTFANHLAGGDGDDTISGGFGNDTIDGGAGDDTLHGEADDDDVRGGAGDDDLFGDEGNDHLVGGAGNDELDGGLGFDKMEGGAGNDVYVVDNAADVVIEHAHQGVDTVITTLGTYVLGQDVENLTFDGAGAFTGTGNSPNNTIISLGGDSTLDGGAGDDVLIGNFGNDHLIGGAGNDFLGTEVGVNLLEGGAGNDTYEINDNDTAVEQANAGIDTIIFDGANPFALPDNFENLRISGGSKASVTGNSVDNVMTGDFGDNTLNGGAGNDHLSGGDGNDTLSGDAGDDVIMGGAGNDQLEGGSGKDTLAGGAGDDIYLLNDAGDATDKVIEGHNAGFDTVEIAFTTPTAYHLQDNVEDLELSGAATRGIGNDLENVIQGETAGVAYHLDGGGGGDVLNGNTGDDTLIGGSGNDIFNADSGNDTIDGGDGRDIANGSDGNDHEAGGGGDDILNGDGGDDTLIGGSGDDDLLGGTGADRMSGGTGDDIYHVDNAGDVVTEAAHQGIDTVFSTINYGLADNVENLTLVGNTNLLGVGNALDNVIKGSGGNDELIGALGDDTLDGGAGNDLLIGGDGNDTYIVGIEDTLHGSSLDVIQEDKGGGIDTEISSGFDTTLAENVENLVLTRVRTDIGHTLGRGNELDNVIVGSAGANVLIGRGGDDTLIGGKGNDEYWLRQNDGHDKVVEKGGGGDADTVDSALDNYTLPANVENLFLLDFDSDVVAGGGNKIGDINGTGNALDNLLIGNSHNNRLDGGAGDDEIRGGDGNDTLFGGAGDDELSGDKGDDQMHGGAGNDVYVVEDAGDKVFEGKNAGIDEVFSSVSFDLSANGANVEILELRSASGTADFTGIGNDLANSISSDDGNDTLSGRGGNDRIQGEDGTDTLNGDQGNDVLFGDAGDDHLFGGDGNDTMDLRVFSDGQFDLDAAAGADEMHGGKGNDTYFVDNAGDTVFEAVGEGVDTVKSIITYSLAAGQEIENLVLVGANAIDGTGNEIANTIVGNANANMLTGGGGADTLVGGDGGDFYILNAGDAHDKVIETGKHGIDIVQIHFDTPTAYHLSAGVEELFLNDGASTAIGNDLGNFIEGVNDGVSYHLGGGGGNDTLIGAGGNDALAGGAGDDELFGGGGTDHLAGGTGNDTYVLDNASDVVIEAKNAGTDTILAGFSFDLSAHGENVENLLLQGNGDIEGHGNALNNQIQGNAGSNLLTGGAGNDHLFGNDGNDVLHGDAGNDVLVGGLGADTMSGGAGNDAFVYQITNTAQITQIGGDTITDFQSGHDKIDLRDLFTDFGLGHKGNPIADGHLILSHVGNDTLVQFDADGAGGAPPVTLATVTNANLTAGDIVH